MNLYGYGSFSKHPKNLRGAAVRVTGTRHDDIIGLGGDAFSNGKQVCVLF
ncbi:hypothetical protein ACWCRD_32855 [Streptomyces sp. NPDC002092]